MRKQLILGSRLLLFVLSLTGTFLEIYKYGGHMLMYYTVLSNLFVTLFTFYLVLEMVIGKDWERTSLLRVKGGVTMSIMITCVIYHFMLAPLADDFWRVENLLCHYIVPLYFLADTLLLDRPRQYRWFDPIIWTALPLLYMVFGLFNGLVLKIPIPDADDSPFAYFFLNVTKYGWAYVLTYAGTIFVAYLLAGFVLYGLKRLDFTKK
ncbi:Pr6Pr family membrane protein [Streptococcus caprae]|uniref:Pr6Pr family membrane protein n=1 Tax=Streptococcus caprae TaxID=1640501 RepID=A0ABV8CY43_9STRE